MTYNDPKHPCGALCECWRRLLYVQQVRDMTDEQCALLDEVQTLLPLPSHIVLTVTMFRIWIAKAEKLGLLTFAEYESLNKVALNVPLKGE